MADFEKLKGKYQSVINLAKAQSASLKMFTSKMRSKKFDDGYTDLSADLIINASLPGHECT